MFDYMGLNLLSVLIAYGLDLVLGDPESKLHPVRLIGLLISSLEKFLYQYPYKLLGGFLLFAFTVFISTMAADIILSFASLFGGLIYLTANSIMIYFCISIRSMTEHADAVRKPLEYSDIYTARQKLSWIVSRDTAEMNEEMIVRSTVESVSENFTDGVFSPLFYAVFFGGAGVVFFKAVSTLDSMVGYRNEKYEEFGKVSAKADDILNFIPARLASVVIAFAGIAKGASFFKTMSVVQRFRLAHPSPNSAHSMSAFAGVLNVTLGGAVSYFGKLKEKPLIGDGDAPLTSETISRAIALYRQSALVAVLILVVLPMFWMML